MAKKPMTCPACNMTMIHHAEKLVDPFRPQDRALVDPVLGGIIQEVHTCPECGKAESRQAR
jgi:predicted RNA-binding Zn-ribbon protein involved in translation (DUF1610 family)